MRTASGVTCNPETIKAVVIESGVTSVGDNAFTDYWDPDNYKEDAYCQLTSVSMADTVTSIGENAFGSAENLQEIKLSEGLVSIDIAAFVDVSRWKALTFRIVWNP